MNFQEREQLVNELKEEYPIYEQTKWNEFNINDKLQENTKLKLYYQELLDKEKFIYDKLTEKYDEVKGQRYDFYKFESDRNLTKTEIEQYYLKSDKKLKKVREVLDKQEIKVKFFEICCRSIDNLYWRIKAYLDNERIN